jgi:hypothetical protein
MLAAYLANAPVASLDKLEGAIPDVINVLRNGKVLPPVNGRPPILKTHFLPSAEVMSLYRSQTGKVVYIVRNPRDVILSAARHMNVGTPRKGAFAKEFVARRGLPMCQEKSWGTWPRNVGDWTSPETVREFFPGTDLLVLRYEDMRADPAGKLREIIEFIGLGPAVEPDRLRRAVESSALERMRSIKGLSQRRKLKWSSGIHAFRDRRENQFLGQGLTNQSLAFLGEGVETAYRQLLTEDEEFSLCAKRYGYED